MISHMLLHPRAPEKRSKSLGYNNNSINLLLLLSVFAVLHVKFQLCQA